MMRSSLISLLGFLLASCAGDARDRSQNLRKQAIEEIRLAEKEFQKMTVDKNIMEAFWFYADSNAVIKREHDTLIHGKEEIRKYYSAPFYLNASVTWSPDFTSASETGDFGYTYGKYTWTTKDSAGNVNDFQGIFHTVWKKQSDGTWKFVWD